MNPDRRTALDAGCATGRGGRVAAIHWAGNLAGGRRSYVIETGRGRPPATRRTRSRERRRRGRRGLRSSALVGSAGRALLGRIRPPIYRARDGTASAAWARLRRL